MDQQITNIFDEQPNEKEIDINTFNTDKQDNNGKQIQLGEYGIGQNQGNLNDSSYDNGRVEIKNVDQS